MSTSHPSPDTVRHELMLTTKSILAPVALGLAALYTYFTIAHLAVLPPATRVLMAPIAAVSALFYVGIWFFFERRDVSDRWIYPLTIVYFSVASINSNLHLLITSEAYQTTNVMLLLIASGYFLMSTRWFLLTMLTVLIPWWYAFQQVASTEAELSHYQFAMVTTLFVAGLIHYVHRHTATDEIILRLRETAMRERQAREAHRMEQAVRVSQRLNTSLEKFPLLEQIAHSLRTQFDLYIVSFFRFVPATAEQEAHLKLQAMSTAVADEDTADWPTIISLSQGPVGWVAHHHNALFVPDVTQDKRYKQWADNCATRAEITLPLLAGNELLGVLDLQSDQLHAFDHYDFTIFQILAEQTAVALQNVALYGHVRAFNESLEAEVQKRTRDLQEAYQKLEKLDQAKSDFIAVAAHELRTPLTHISSYTQLVERTPGAKNDERIQRYVKHIHQGIQRLTTLMESMLDIVKIDHDALELMPSLLSIADLVAYVLAQLEPGLAERALTIDTTAVAQVNLPPIEGDLQLLRKLLYELLINAIKHTPDGGTITISAHHLPDTAEIELVIQDSGVGLAREEQELVFSKFYQTGAVNLHSSGTTRFMAGGAGLGLAIVQGIVTAHHGRVWLESPGHHAEECPGTAVFVRLPLTLPRETAIVNPS